VIAVRSPAAAFADDAGKAILANAPEKPPALGHSSSRRRLFYVTLFGVLLLIGLLIISLDFFRNRGSVRAGTTAVPAVNQTGTFRTLVRMEGAQYQPAWSRDGRRLAFAYSDPNDSGSAIYIQTTGEMRPRRIAFSSGEYSSPSFSPDGKSLAYLHVQPNLAEVLIYDLATFKTRRLTTLPPHHYGLSGRQLDWSPTGDFLVLSDKEAESDPLSLYLVFVSNGSKVRLTYPDMDILGDTSPRFSPDGKQVAFIRMKYQFEYDVFVVAVTGGEVRKLTNQSSVLGDVDWETNNLVAYSGDRDGEFRLWQVDLQSPNPRVVAASSIATDMPLQFSISRATRQIAFSGYQPDLNIWALDLSKKSPSISDWTPVIRTSGQDIAPVFSPDGKKIAFRSDVSGQLQIWVSHADGSNAAPIHTGALLPSVIAWTPDSQSIVFSTSSAPGIYQVSLSHKFPLRRISEVHMSHPFYSVDSKWIFAEVGGFIYRIPVLGGSAEMLTDQGGTPIVESKDGRYLYFGHERMDTTISRLDLATRQQETVVRSLIPGYRDAWALTSRGIVFLTEEAGKPMIVFHDFATGTNRNIGDFPGPLPLIATSGFSVSPNGHTLLVVRADPVSADIQTAMFSSSADSAPQPRSALVGP